MSTREQKRASDFRQANLRRVDYHRDPKGGTEVQCPDCLWYGPQRLFKAHWKERHHG